VADNRSLGAPVDIAVIGGGVVGCAVARRFSLLGASVALLEKAPDILAGASKGNSALLHTGFDAPPASLELHLMQAGYREYIAIRRELGLPLLETGAMVVAWNYEEAARLEGLAAIAVGNGVTDTRLLTAAEVLAREPSLAPHVRGALLVPGEHVIDPWSAPLAYLTQALAHGAQAWFGAEVLAGKFNGTGWLLDTARGTLRAGHVINCAGLYGDIVEQRCLGEASFTIRPRKGQFVVFDKPAARLFTTTLLPVPTERTKGVVLARTIFGNVLVGPTAEEQTDRDRASVDQAALKALVAKAVEMVPALAAMPVNAAYAGLRPASDTKAYRIRHERDRHWVTLGGIRSTGLTSALGLATHAADLVGGGAWAGAPVTSPVWPACPNLAEHLPRDWQTPGYGEIVCHCEMVTSREIEAALASPLPPGDFGGLRRRTRAGMGRCQGFYCGAKLARMTRGRLASPLAIPHG
jgi:glycerol-3-phosphate dehydrogenase